MSLERTDKERQTLVGTTYALAPAAFVLVMRGSFFSVIYLSSMIVAALYHESDELRYRELDHALAYSVIVANIWMASHSSGLVLPFAGVGLVLLALWCYMLARRDYARFHSAWHVLSGLAGLAFAWGYRP